MTCIALMTGFTHTPWICVMHLPDACRPLSLMVGVVTTSVPADLPQGCTRASSTLAAAATATASALQPLTDYADMQVSMGPAKHNLLVNDSEPSLGWW